ncbi:two-component system, sensor histidine kinase YesM [Clostridium sp. USBA 49]|uniref:sensor histidine kinase n=1 Tax=Clostridium sp. USBA 49 TaxID=1881060 RepID=UPI00099A919E|nr:histidine kinase [Clostridium sp. USBA 49]SKA78264.1 two-component system, sensor histidine kinase YesM [Clostridium sp. USBA 49]
MKFYNIKSSFNYFKFKTLHQRLIFILVIETSIILLLLSLASYYTIHSIEKNKLKASMVSDLEQITYTMTESYLNMIQISQQMSPEGTVGSLLENYFQEDSTFDKYLISQQILDSLVKITFANSDIVYRAYFDPSNNCTYFYNFASKDNFLPQNINVLKQNGSIYYHSIHKSIAMGLSTWDVLSISRKINMSNGKELIIYIESKIESKEIIDALSKSQNMNYILLQLDYNNKIKFSSTNDFTLGKVFQLNNESKIGNGYFGKYEKYVGVRVPSNTGYTNVLLLPAKDYNHEFYIWIRNVIGILFISLFLFGFSFIALYRLIYTPLFIFSKEMKKLGKGDLKAVSISTGVMEYDELFKQFDIMKHRIQNLLLDVEKVAQEKHQLEIEKIYHQINPHFLMNTLHSIHWLAKMQSQTEIEIFTKELNYILAYSLNKVDKQATIRTEIKILKSYLKLQKMRYDFQVKVNIEEGDYLDTPTARMILQPIAENAIQHGLGESGCLNISISHLDKDNIIIITFEDNGKGLSADELNNIKQALDKKSEKDNTLGGIGLKYVCYMLESFYKDKAKITIESELSHGTKVTLIMPIYYEK